MESNGLKLENISVDLVTFYHGIIQKKTDTSDVLSNRKTLHKLRKKYSNKLRRNDSCSISFDSLDVRNAYLFQFGPSFSLAMAQHFLMLMKSISHQQQVQRFALKDSLSICCLGGGPGTEVVAICRVLQEVRRRYAPNVEKPLMVDATIVDVESGWSTTVECVLSSMSKFVDASVVQIGDFRFIEHDLTREASEDISTALSQSDVVTMTKFLSALHGARDPGTRTNILQDTCKHIPVGSLLFLIDSSGWNCFDEVVRTVCSLSGMEQVYGPARKTSRLSQTSKNLCHDLFSTIYGGQVCTAQSSNKASAWLKTSVDPAS